MKKKSKMMRVHVDFYTAVKRFQDDLEKTTNSEVTSVDVTKLFAGRSPSVMLVDKRQKKRRSRKKYEFTRLF